MATYSTNATTGVSTSNLWIDNAADSTGEGFAGLQSSSGSVLLGAADQTYSEYTFQSGGLTYRYIGEWNLTFTGNLVAGTVAASGFYTQVQVYDGAQLVTSYSGAQIPVDFGTAPSDVLTGGSGLLDVVTDVLFGDEANPVANLHLDATPGLPDLAFAGADTISGGSGDDVLDGKSGADAITAGGGDDIIIGGAGADLMAGGAGSDTYYVDTSGDLVFEANVAGVDTVNSSVTFSLFGQFVENLTLTGSDAVNGTGNSLNNVLIGNAGANTLIGFAGNDRLDGGAGADRLEGGIGNDAYVVDNVGDVVIEADGQGIDSVSSSVSFTLFGQYIENLTLTGTSSINGSGNGLSNLIVGNSGNNIIDGGNGADRMVGGLGDDTYIVAQSGDRVVEADGGGVDTVNSLVSFSMFGQYIENLNLVGNKVADASGNGLDNVITGNSAINHIDAGGGADRIDGGLGADVLTGGSGLDTFVFSTALGGGNIDRIVDFRPELDTIELSVSVFGSSLGRGELDATAFTTGSAATDAAHRIVYNATTGGLFFDADGSGSGVARQFATLDPHLTLTNSDFAVL